MIETEAAWHRLDEELEHWQEGSGPATLWWRDDDAGAWTPALGRLLALAERRGVPLALAAVPAWIEAELPTAIAACAGLRVFQHGYAHVNHAPAGEKSSELGLHRPAALVVAELAQGWQRLESAFGAKFLPVLVPPWNRLAPSLPPWLAELRYKGLSQFGPRQRAQPIRGLIQANAHVDIVHWRSAEPRFGGAAKLIDEITVHLAARRRGAVDAAEPTGLLTHHRAHDEASWVFLDELLGRLARHHTLRWLDPEAVFSPAAGP